jgi:outer membrane protein
MLYRLISLLSILLLGTLSLTAQEDTWDLRRCVDYALENNIQIKQSALNVESSKSNLDQSKLSRYPNLNGNVNFSDNIGYVNDPFTNEFSNTNIRSGNLSLSSGVNLFSGFQTTNTIKRNEVNMAASQMDQAQMQNNITLQVVNAYLNILFSHELVESSEAQLATIRERRDRTKKLVDAGTQPMAALLDLDSQLATEELNFVNMQNQLSLAYLNLQQLLTLEPSASFEVVRPEDISLPDYNMGPGRSNDIYRAALSNQPNVRAAELRITAAEYNEKIANAGRLPSIGVQANVFTGYSSARQQITGFRTVFDTLGVQIGGQTQDVIFSQESPNFGKYPLLNQLFDQRNFSIGAGMSVPIFQRGFNTNQMQLAEIQKRNATYTSELVKQQLKQTIQQAYLDVAASKATYDATIKQVTALETTFRNSEKQFNLGVINSVDYLLAKNNLIRAQNDRVRTKYDYIFKTKILDFYEGKPIVLE